MACIVSIIYNKEAKCKDKVFPCFFPPNTNLRHLTKYYSILSRCHFSSLSEHMTWVSPCLQQVGQGRTLFSPTRDRWTMGDRKAAWPSTSHKETRSYGKFAIAEKCTTKEMDHLETLVL